MVCYTNGAASRKIPCCIINYIILQNLCQIALPHIDGQNQLTIFRLSETVLITDIEMALTIFWLSEHDISVFFQKIPAPLQETKSTQA